MKIIGLVLIFFGIQVSAQNTNRFFKSIEGNEKVYEIEVNDGHYRLIPINEHIVEVSFVPNGENFDPVSHAVVAETTGSFDKTEENDHIRLSTNGIEVHIQKKPFQLSFYYNERLLISEKRGFFRDVNEKLQFNLSEDEKLFGGGARALGMNRRGHKLELYNKAHYGYETRSELMNYTLPLVFSSKLYAVHFDNAPIGFLDLDSEQNNTLTYETISGRKTYQIVAADTWDGLISEYTYLTGRQPMIPRWALGNFSSRFGYHSQKETLATIKKFKKEQIPVDAVILDLYWFGKDIKGTMGNLEFDKDSFPNPQQMIIDLNNQGVKTILITEPFILNTSSKWDEAVSKGILGTKEDGTPYNYEFYFGNTGIIDIFKPEGNEWFWNVYKKYADMGIAGWWGDLGEPEVHPSDLLHATGTADEVHNIYGHYWAKLIADGYRETYPEARPFILMRAGYSGSQRFGLIPWSGDVNRTWGGLQSQVEIALQMNMQGLAYMHSDLGGFAGPNLDDELYVRWLQYGVFQPIYRPHAQEEVASEPVFRSEWAKKRAKQAIELRYSLLPYNYTMSFQNSVDGTPLMRPLFFEDEKEALLNYDDAYFWGEHFLVSPVKQAGLKEQEVYFPESANWYDFYTKRKYKGGTSQTIELNENQIPVFVRAGAFVPMIDPIQNTEEYSLDNLKLHYYFDASVKSGHDQLYHDDGLTSHSFDKGEYEILNCKVENVKDHILFKFEKKIGEHWSSTLNSFELIIHNFPKRPKKMDLNTEWQYNSAIKELRITVPITENLQKQLKIYYK